jgi:glucose-1-phosphate cytidylyltransferase
VKSPKVVILCGGEGTRLREETEYRPKPMVDIGGRPMLWHIMKMYAHFGFADFVLCLGYKGAMIKSYFLEYETMNSDFTLSLGKPGQIQLHDHHQEHGFTVTLADTGLKSSTGTRLKLVQKYIDSGTFMVTYGDGVSDVPLDKLLAFHRAHGKLATVTAVRPVSRFGTIQIESGGEVRAFMEKPQLGSWVSAGFFVFSEGAFDYLSVAPDCTLEREPLERMAHDGELVAYQHDGFFFAMDTYREYLVLNDLWESGEAPWKRW